MSALLELRDVTKRFGGVVANDAISLSVPEGAIVGLIGPNGWPAAGRGQPRGGQSRSQSGRRIFGSRVMAPVSDEGGMGHGVSVAELDRLAGPVPVLAVDHLDAGYGRMRVLRDLSLSAWARGTLANPRYCTPSTASPASSRAPSDLMARMSPGRSRAPSSRTLASLMSCKRSRRFPT
jgi:hypothetical protein